MKMTNIFCLFFLIITPFFAFAQGEKTDLMPIPAQMQWQEGKFRLDRNFALSLNGTFADRLFGASSRFLRRLETRTGLFLKQGFISKKDNLASANLQIQVQKAGELKLHEDESYEIEIQNQKILISANTDLGVLRAFESVLQVIKADAEGYFFPCGKINDQPRFAWRGLMIDVARHFMPIEVIKRNLDAMTAVKLNVFHFHLTDNQGFRIESKTFPKLHELGSDGEYYTQTEIKEIVKYAADRGIRVVPEFDLPAHATAWLLAYPELGSKDTIIDPERKAGIFDPVLDPTNEKVYDFLDKLFAELFPLFPDLYVHIGGDENEAGRHWTENAQIQKFMKDNKIADNHALQAYFNQRMLKIFTKFNKKMVGWEEIMHPNVPTEAVIHSWFGKESLFKAAQKGYPTILSNGYYIDLMFSVTSHYLNDPILPEGAKMTDLEKSRILGGEATMWSELVSPHTIDSRIWPRMIAIAERFWSPAHVNDVEDMFRRMEILSIRLEEFGLNHIKNRDVILRNLAGGSANIEALKVLADVIEPMKKYSRNPKGELYTMLSPLTLMADAANADAPAARKFKILSENYLKKPNEADKAEIMKYLALWKNNHAEIAELCKKSPALREMEKLSENLSLISGLALEILTKEKTNRGEKILKTSSLLFEEARKQGGRTELQVVDAIENLLK